MPEPLLDFCLERRSSIPGSMVTQAIIWAESPAALVQLNGISVLERLLRTLDRCGLRQATIFSASAGLMKQHISDRSPHRAKLRVKVERALIPLTSEQLRQTWPNDSQSLLFVRGDMVFDSRLLQALVGSETSTALVDQNIPATVQRLVAVAADIQKGKFCGAALIRREWVWDQSGPLVQNLITQVNERTLGLLDVAAQPRYSPDLRRELRPFWFPAPSSKEKKFAEKLLIDSAQKGSLDLPAWIHAPLENLLITWLAKWPITPNQLTILSNVVAWAVTLLFATGHLNAGIVLALVVGVLDGLDGKQARVKVETSPGGKLEHWFDGAFELSWWTALAYHFHSTGQLPEAFRYLILLLSAELVDAAAKGSVLFTFRKLIDELGPFERFVRLFGGRRNIYVWILAIGSLLGAPARAFIVMAWWEVVTAALHIPRAAWVLARKNKIPCRPSA
jgi:1L-myo-inositol 1-phosphate cytidylyltransferase / CDP-L-myo-inositol myo-inositolphosphotransferase